MSELDVSEKLSNAEMMKIELCRSKPRFPKLSIWLYVKPYGFHISALYYALLVVLILALGILASIVLRNPLWLSRFGSFVIALGVLFGVHGIEGKIQSDIRYCNEIVKAIEKDEHEAQLLSCGNSFENTPKQIIRDFDFLSSQAFSALREDEWKKRIIRNTLRIDAAFAIIGTLVWGFGDLIIPIQQLRR